MVSFMNILPVETVTHIVQYLSTSDANRFGQTCMRAYDITNCIVYKDNVPTRTKRGPVTWGVVTGQLRVIEMAVAAGADVSAHDWLFGFQYELGLTGRFNDQAMWWWGDEACKEGQGSPLHYAAMINNTEAAEYLLRHGASHSTSDNTNWSIDMCPCRVRHRREDDSAIAYLPLHTAACHGNLDVARVLLENGASVYKYCAKRHGNPSSHRWRIYNDPPLHHKMVDRGQSRLAMIELIARYSDGGLDDQDANGWCPLSRALQKPNNGDMIAKLVHLGAGRRPYKPYEYIELCLEVWNLENALALLESDLYSKGYPRPFVDVFFCALVAPLDWDDLDADWVFSTEFWEKWERPTAPLAKWDHDTVLEMPEEAIKRIVHVLIEKYGFDINTPLGGNGYTPLNFIIQLGNRTKLKFMFTLLVNLGARLDVADKHGHNPLIACLRTQYEYEYVDRALRKEYDKILPLLIRVSWHHNVDMDTEYTWEGKPEKLSSILKVKYRGWYPVKSLPNKLLWRSLNAHLSGIDEDNEAFAGHV